MPTRTAVRGEDETALAGVRVTLLDDAGEQLATVSTDEEGAFYLDELFPGEYSLRFDAPDGYAAVGTQGLIAPRDGAYVQTVPAALTAGGRSRCRMRPASCARAR